MPAAAPLMTLVPAKTAIAKTAPGPTAIVFATTDTMQRTENTTAKRTQSPRIRRVSCGLTDSMHITRPIGNALSHAPGEPTTGPRSVSRKEEICGDKPKRKTSSPTASSAKETRTRTSAAASIDAASRRSDSLPP